MTQTVGQAPTETTLNSAPNPSIVGDMVTFSAFVTGVGVSGSVVFSEGGVTLATVPLPADNIAVYQTRH